MSCCFLSNTLHLQIVVIVTIICILKFSAEDKIYIKDLNVQPVLFKNRALQLLINWKSLNLTGVTFDVLVKPIMHPNHTCSERPCSVYSVNETSILMPKNPLAIVQEECQIQPMCSYNVIVSTSNRKNYDNVTLSLPDCVEHICSCHHSKLLPSITIGGQIISKYQINITWSLNRRNTLPDNITIDLLNLELGEQGNPTYIYRLLQRFSENITDSDDFQSNGSKLFPISKSLVPGKTYVIKGHLSDIRNCDGAEDKKELKYLEKQNNEEQHQQSRKNHDLLTILIGLILTMVAIFLVISFVRVKRCRKRKKNLQNWRGVYHNVSPSGPPLIQMHENCIYIDNDILEARAKGEADFLEVPHYSLTVGREIGKGAFGRVFIARADNIGLKPGPQIVAIKQLKKRPTTDELEEFLGEIATMKKVGHHPNVVSLLGCCTIKQPLIMIMEYVGCGDLLQYLRQVRAKHEIRCAFENSKSIVHSESMSSKFSGNSGPSQLGGAIGGKYVDVLHNSSSNSDASYITQPDSVPSILRPSVTETLYTMLGSQDRDSIKTNNSIEYVLDHNELKFFAIQIARGMKHLEEKQITHRDLAARNILIDEHKVLKISDFGLSRTGIYVNTRNKKVPLRWLSIEAMRDNLYSNRSDVWAFAIVLWEIGTLGGFPYPTVGNHELLAYLQAGNRLAKPDNCSTILYDLMMKCWSNHSEDRPTFAEICCKLEPRKERIYIDFNELGPNYALPPTAEQVQNGLQAQKVT